MSNETVATSITPSEFTIMDEMDNQQIQTAESAIKQALAYDVRGKKQLSYMGIKWLVLKMSQKEQALEILDLPCIELMKHGGEDQKTWAWYVTVKVRNLKTGLVTVGASESPFLTNNVYDTFGRTKAISKAERNAYRKQIPEIEINAMLESISPEDIESSQSSGSTNKPSQKQLDYLKNLGYNGITPKTKEEASKIIKEYKNKSKESDSKYCACVSPIPNSITNGKTCQICHKLLEVTS